MQLDARCPLSAGMSGALEVSVVTLICIHFTASSLLRSCRRFPARRQDKQDGRGDFPIGYSIRQTSRGRAGLSGGKREWVPTDSVETLLSALGSLTLSVLARKEALKDAERMLSADALCMRSEQQQLHLVALPLSLSFFLSFLLCFGGGRLGVLRTAQCLRQF